MEQDFSVLGREKSLSETYYDDSGKFENYEFNFARWTLLERVIWQVQPANTYCHLDGLDFDRFHDYGNGFLGVGRVFLLNDTKSVGNIYTAMAIDFDPYSKKVRRGRYWVSRMPAIRGSSPPTTDIPPLKSLFSKNQNLGHDWSIALTRNSSHWKLDPGFDLSIFLNTRDD